MLRGTVTALTRSADAAGVLVIGGLLTLLTWVVTPVWIGGALLFPPLVLLAPLTLAPAFVARGYFVRVLAAGIRSGNADGAPPFVAWNELYRDGLKSAFVSAVLLAPLAVGVSLAALAGVALGSDLVDPTPVAEAIRTALGDGGIAAVVGVAGGLVAAVAFAYLLAFAYVRPAALASFAASGRLRDGLRPRRVAGVADSGAYATAWVVAAATLGAGYALAGPFIPLVVGAALVFVARVAAYGLYGRGAAATLEVVDTGDADESAAPIAAEPDERSTDLVRPPTPEVPAAVQTGRTVPLGGVSVGGTRTAEARADGSASHRTDGAVEAGDEFDWFAPDGEPLDRDERDAAGTRGTAGGDEFEWSADAADPEDKS
ncbi:hypothetical protein C471_04755 [Halorubrum saccharovorum DSM 1137]|uniref:DUF4013 domain-containing protein n=1 Tax=Halorubrum saccharovorum DSM 1137 TaxID=1227484 RepID=M0E5X8_9EURY|nr:DUF4013 domain-containing protein [Halorubrum saccharovorum]ELZ42322.1 hypothetical protein C471_04755 [Halorubrum saccharovorum DSM 1137]